MEPSSRIASTSTVGLPRLSKIWRATISTIAVMGAPSGGIVAGAASKSGAAY